MAWRKGKQIKKPEPFTVGTETSAVPHGTNPLAHFKARMRWEKQPTADLSPWFHAWLELETDGSDPVFIHHIEAAGAHFGSTNHAVLNRWNDLQGGQPI